MDNSETVCLLMRLNVRNSIPVSDGFGCSEHILNALVSKVYTTDGGSANLNKIVFLSFFNVYVFPE